MTEKLIIEKNLRMKNLCHKDRNLFKFIDHLERRRKGRNQEITRKFFQTQMTLTWECP